MSTFDNVVELYKGVDHELENHGNLNFLQIKHLNTGLSITRKEVDYFQRFKDEFTSPKIFIIGNAFGFSTFVMNQIFKDSSIDVIDAECEGINNRQGSEITNRIIQKYDLDIKLTIGYSPHDVAKAVRYDSYDIVFIDGLHTNEQMFEDFKVMKPYLNKDKFICFFHDVGLCSMQSSMDKIVVQNDKLYDKYVVQLPDELSESGMGILSKNVVTNLL